MKCSKCGHVMEPPAPQTIEAEVRKTKVQIEVLAPRCGHCGRVGLSGKAIRLHYRAASDAYRRQAKLLTTQDLDRLRRDLKMTWKEFAEYVFVGIATLKRWMRGEIQSEALDRLVRLRTDLQFIEKTATELAGRLASSGISSAAVQPVKTVPRKKVHWNDGSSSDGNANAA